MRAFRYQAFGASARRGIESVPVPEPGPGELLVRVEYASLNPVDWKIADGAFRLLVRGGLPRTMGSDYAGEVVSVGLDVTGWSPGDPVMGFLDPFARAEGSFAEFVRVPVDFAFRRPANVDAPTGASLPCIGLTAVALCSLTMVRRGSNVLVNGASGGVGHVALQVAKSRGARVTATASAARRDFVESLGADAFIDYREAAVDQWPTGFDAVLDCVPSLPRARHRRLLVAGGHYASTLPSAWTYTLDPLLNRLGPVARHAIMLRPGGPAMAELLAALDCGQLRCEIEEVFPLEQTDRAIERSRSSRVAGKLLIRVA